jgi:thiamine biosynthesis lipoprotein
VPATELGPVEATAPASRFEALGTYVHVATYDAQLLPAATRLVREVLVEVDRTCSRFRPDSDLSRANRAPGRRVPVDRMLVEAVEVAAAVAEETSGLVTPLLGRTLVELGYDRDFDLLEPDGCTGSSRPDFDAWRRLETGSDWIRVPAGTALDLGSIGKAWASDLAVSAVHIALGGGVLVSLGGDIAVAGDDTWPVEIREHPETQHPDEVLWMTGGALATSSIVVRRWRQCGAVRHHVVDPRTGLPAIGGWRTVTATGPTCAAANAAATAAIVLGDEAVDWLERHGVDARLVTADGAVVRVGGWPEGLR